MKKVLIMLLVLPLISCSQKKKEVSSDKVENEPAVVKTEEISTSNLNGIYEYAYEHNSDDFIENHYMEFKKEGGTYFGTSDDFDDGREGYLPGFFKTKMNDFKKIDDKISFNLTVNDSIFYSKSVIPLHKIEGNEKWDNSLTSKTRQYQGSINGDTIVIKTKDFDPRVFVKIKK